MLKVWYYNIDRRDKPTDHTKGRNKQMTKEELKKITTADISTSKKMVAMYSAGMEIADIASTLGKRYNHAYNVISDYCRVHGVELRVKSTDGTKKEAIIALVKDGRTNVEISTALQISYTRVYNVRKEFERELAEAK